MMGCHERRNFFFFLRKRGKGNKGIGRSGKRNVVGIVHLKNTG